MPLPVLFRNIAVVSALTQGFALRAAGSDGLSHTDIAFVDGVFADARGLGEVEGIDASGMLLLPGFVDCHVHLDKAYTARRTGVSRAGLDEAVRLAMGDFKNRSEADLDLRMERALARAFANGTVALRTHLDTPDMPAQSPAWRVLGAKRQAWADRIVIQPVALMALSRLDDVDDFDRRAGEIAERDGILGAFVSAGSATPERLDRLFSIAERHRLDIDLHVDETLDATANGLSLLADARLRSDFSGRVVAGHCCALAHKSPEVLADTITRVESAGIDVVSLPMTNGYLQDAGPDRTPRLRGIAPVKELAQAGISVAFASDNVQDAFFPFGDFDMLQVLRQAVMLGQLECDAGQWLPAVFDKPAAMMGLKKTGRIGPGARADAVIFDAGDLIDLFSKPCLFRRVYRAGSEIADRHFPDRAQHSPERLKRA
ncbi:amidohydrolase family protein [Martelella alba]|uniref:Amidohydrolase family protein n=1 Tax=Martelella alba TaxID=2590451 RepID=A0A506U427_9HYPH|nr:amidohydrolase family protein [Martelella alba]TPW29102.1 amidohydrolase family protein [Martelella alba]